MKVYTKTGDNGTTSLVGGTRVPKDDARLEAYGTVDELNSWIGLIYAVSPATGKQPLPDPGDAATLRWIQNKLFDLGSQLATEPESKWRPRGISDTDVSRIESEIDRIESSLPRHNRFILPGGTEPSARAQIARTVARRAERRMITMGSVDAPAMRFINRLSDYLFVLGRRLNAAAGEPELFWDQDA